MKITFKEYIDQDNEEYVWGDNEDHVKGAYWLRKEEYVREE